MTATEVVEAREAIADLPEGTSYGEPPGASQVYLPRSHLRAMHPDNLLVTGMRGAGKTFWWSALQEAAVRDLVGRFADPPASLMLSEKTDVRAGFGFRAAPDEYPGKDAISDLTRDGIEPRVVWRTVYARHLAPDGHPLRTQATWRERVAYVAAHPEPIERLFYERDAEFDARGVHFLVLFDALDRCADDWEDLSRSVRGLLQVALDQRAYRRLRMKIFLRSDQFDERTLTDFPDASKLLASSVALNWPRHELYGLFWHCLVNGPNGVVFRDLLGSDVWTPVQVSGQTVYPVPRPLIFREEHQRKKFHLIAGRWMGADRRRGFPYTWIPNHLGDTEGRVSPRSFLAALRAAAADTADRRPEHPHALHYDSIKRGVQAASQIRVREIQEDYPWMHQVLSPLGGMSVPCDFEEIAVRWQQDGVLEHLFDRMQQDAVKLPPRHIDQGPDGVRRDLEGLRVFYRLFDGRVNIPDVFRLGYGLGRKGGVKPVK